MSAAGREARPVPVRRGRRVPPALYAALVVGIFAGTIGVGAVTGTWQTSGRTEAGGGQVAPQGESVTEVKGWMAIGAVADAWAVPLDELLLALGLPADTDPETPLKDLESDTFSVAALREWLAALPAATP